MSQVITAAGFSRIPSIEATLTGASIRQVASGPWIGRSLSPRIERSPHKTPWPDAGTTTVCPEDEDAPPPVVLRPGRRRGGNDRRGPAAVVALRIGTSAVSTDCAFNLGGIDQSGAANTGAAAPIKTPANSIRIAFADTKMLPFSTFHKTPDHRTALHQLPPRPKFGESVSCPASIIPRRIARVRVKYA